MRRIWLVITNTYRRQVNDKGFVATLLSVPLLITGMLALMYVTVELREDRRPVGYVDNAGVLTQALPQEYDSRDSPLRLIAFASTAAARRALESDDIQAYYVIAADYLSSSAVDVVSKAGQSGAGAAEFHDLLRYNLLAGVPDDVARRIALGMSVTIRAPQGGREFPEVTSLGGVAPILIVVFMALGFMLLVAVSPGQPMLAVAEEKENRTIEILVTSVSPRTLIAGKVIGSAAVAGTLVAGWGLLVAALAFVAVRWLGIPWLQDIRLLPSDILFPASLYVPVYVIIAALMTALGSTVVEAREAQQMSFIFVMPLMIPFYMLQPVMENPDSAWAVALSLFPLSAPVVLALRVLVQPVPAWQVALSMSLMVLSAAGAIWLAGRAFRLGMLRLGQRLTWRELFDTAGGRQ
jgi:ABC-2 type transport system permease protein